MRFYDNHNPSTGVVARIARLPAESIEDFIDPMTVARLKYIAKQKIERPNVADLIVEIPDVVRWLRSAMTAIGKSDDSGGSSGAAGSRPPFRIAAMNAADREVAALAHWCEDYGIVPASSDGLAVRYGAVVGVCGDDLGGVEEMCLRLSNVVQGESEDRLLHMASEPRFGLWSVRQQHYVTWPDLAGFMATEDRPDEPVVEDALF